jgi:tetratricopeptide (TPR) repeat protein
MFNQAALLEKIGKYSACIKWLKRVVELQPDFYIAYIGMTNCYLRLGRNDDAKWAMDLAINKINEKEKIEYIKYQITNRIFR